MPQVDVLIKKNADGQLDEQINLASEFKKVKTRALKGEYKASMYATVPNVVPGDVRSRPAVVETSVRSAFAGASFASPKSRIFA